MPYQHLLTHSLTHLKESTRLLLSSSAQLPTMQTMQGGGGGGGGEPLSDLEDPQKVYRNMELNRKSFAEDSALVLRQQQQKLDKLRKENYDLKADVATLQMRNSHQPMLSFEQDQLAKLYEESARYRDLIEAEKEMLQSMQEQITERRKQIWEHRRMTGGVNAVRTTESIKDAIKVSALSSVCILLLTCNSSTQKEGILTILLTFLPSHFFC